MRASGGFRGSGRSFGAVAATRRRGVELGRVACESGGAGLCIWLMAAPRRVLRSALVCWRVPERSFGLSMAAVVAVVAGQKSFVLDQIFMRVSLLYPTPGSGMFVSSHRHTTPHRRLDSPVSYQSMYEEDRFRYGHRRLSIGVENGGSIQNGQGQTMLTGAGAPEDKAASSMGRAAC